VIMGHCTPQRIGCFRKDHDWRAAEVYTLWEQITLEKDALDIGSKEES